MLGQWMVLKIGFCPSFQATSLETQVVLELLDTVDAWSLVWRSEHTSDFQTAQKPTGFAAGDSGFVARFAHRVPILAVMTGPAMGFSLGRNFFVWSVSCDTNNSGPQHWTQVRVHRRWPFCFSTIPKWYNCITLPKHSWMTNIFPNKHNSLHGRMVVLL